MLREVTKREPVQTVIAEEAVAQGAAIHAAILEARNSGGESRMGAAIIKRLRSVAMEDVNSHSLGVKITDPNNQTQKINHIMIPRNTSIPFSAKQRFVTTSPNQQTIHVYILEGEASDPLACSLIGDFQIVNLPANLPAGSPVEVEYSYDANGRIHAVAQELTGGKQAETEIVRDSGLDTSGIESFKKLAEDYQVE